MRGKGVRHLNFSGQTRHATNSPLATSTPTVAICPDRSAVSGPISIWLTSLSD
jgi:hypothetical protein